MRAMPSPPQLLHQARWRPLWRAWLVVLVTVVACAAFTPGTSAPTLGVGDKADHVLAFVALALAGALSCRAGPRPALAVALALLGYGALIEIVQTQVPGRYGEWADLAADSLGTVLGLAAVSALRRRWPAQGTAAA